MDHSRHLTKLDLVGTFTDKDATDQPFGALALARLPEKFFRRVVDHHNGKIQSRIAMLPQEWHDARRKLEELLIPTYEEFHRRLDDKDAKAKIPPHLRKARDFEIYRDWVLCEEPLAETFRDAFRQPTFPAFIPEKARRRHSFVVGRSGSGKSETLKLLAVAAKIVDGTVRRDRSFVLIDPHGDLAEQIARLSFYHDDRREHPDAPDLIYLDPFLGAKDGRFPTVNPLDVGKKTSFQLDKIAQQLTRVFQTLVARGDVSLTLNMETILIPCITVLLRRPRSTFFDLMRFMTDGINTDLVQLGLRSPNAGHRFFFRESFGESRFQITRAALSTRIQSLLNNQAFAHFLARPASALGKTDPPVLDKMDPPSDQFSGSDPHRRTRIAPSSPPEAGRGSCEDLGSTKRSGKASEDPPGSCELTIRVADLVLDVDEIFRVDVAVSNLVDQRQKVMKRADGREGCGVEGTVDPPHRRQRQRRPDEAQRNAAIIKTMGEAPIFSAHPPGAGGSRGVGARHLPDVVSAVRGGIEIPPRAMSAQTCGSRKDGPSILRVWQR